MKRRNDAKGREQPQAVDGDGGQPLLRALLAMAHTRDDKLKTLAQRLGVSYGRLSQWRRHQGAFVSAKPQVVQRAAEYLGIPVILALVMGQRVGLEDLLWPAPASLTDRVRDELERLRRDPYIGGFLPAEIATASPSVRLFVVFLYHELAARGSPEESQRWLRALHQVATGDLQARAELERLREQEANRTGMF
jgi:transcriptional regulator with XRE-family HTH domain